MIISISLFLISIGIFLFIVQSISRNKKRILKKEEKEPKIAVLIPARDESAVIEELLDSIEKQSIKIKKEDIYIIMESKKDPTYSLAQKKGFSTLFRTTTIQRKGYALDEGIKQILKQKKYYDLYFIFDADNVLDKNFIKEMILSYKKGYKIAIGHRYPKNPNDSLTAVASSLVFLLLNTILNKDRMKKNRGIILSGTGFYIKGEIIEDLKGYPFHTLTEDYELSLYSTVENIPSCYNEKAIYYDEQPRTLKISMIQRTRWIKGFLEVRHKYIPKMRKALMKKDFPSGVLNDLIGITPIVFILTGILFYLGYDIFCITVCFIFQSNLLFHFLLECIIIILTIYFILQGITIFIFIKEKDHLNITWLTKIKVIFYHPIFLVTYIPCAVKALLVKNINWVKIEHFGKKENK